VTVPTLEQSDRSSGEHPRILRKNRRVVIELQVELHSVWVYTLGIMPSFVRTIEQRINGCVQRIDTMLTTYRHHKVAIYACRECWTWDNNDPTLNEAADYIEKEAVQLRNVIKHVLDELNGWKEGLPGHYIITADDQLVLKLS